MYVDGLSNWGPETPWGLQRSAIRDRKMTKKKITECIFTPFKVNVFEMVFNLFNAIPNLIFLLFHSSF